MPSSSAGARSLSGHQQGRAPSHQRQRQPLEELLDGHSLLNALVASYSCSKERVDHSLDEILKPRFEAEEKFGQDLKADFWSRF